jgi:flavin-dependent dehydrogenase
MYDAIIIGARVAGSPTAMLLARRGYKVLLVDRATFPSDTISTHQIQLPGIAALKRWGLLDRVLATEPDAAHSLRLDMNGMVLEAEFPAFDDINAVHSPRRYLLDKILVDAAVEAGAELRENFITEELIWEKERVVGIRGRTKDSGGTITEQARFVIGADGKHSLVAKWVDAPKYDEVPVLTCAYYNYWEGLPVNGGEIYARGKRYIGLWPTNNRMTIVFVFWPAAEFDAFRSDVEAGYTATLNLVPELAERLRQARRAERIVGSGDMPNFYRKPYGPGWALVGDSGYIKDPVSGMGINDAFRDAELLTEALDAGFSERHSIDDALSAYEQKRNAASKPFYDFTLETARMSPLRVEQIELFQALRHNPAAATQFAGIFTCAVKPTDFFTPQNIFQIIGMRGMSRIMFNKIFRMPQRRAS